MVASEVFVQPGQVVRVRSRQYLVDEVRRPERPGQQTVVSLSCLDDDAQGQPLEVLWETELDAEVLAPHDWRSVAERGFDSPRMFGAFLHTQRWNLVTSTNPDLFQAPHRAGIEVMAYQVEPLRKALALPRVNLFIADDVGLGKTIEAGLILRELLLRQRVKRIVVAAPPSVVVQWQQELDQRFGLPFMILDRAYVQRRRKERGHSANPWRTHTRFIVSHALLRDEQYVAPLRDWLGEFCPGSLLILDEAHNAAPASAGSKYAVDSVLTKTLREGLVERFEHRLFLSATPHNGHSNSFSALLELLDPQRFTRGVPVDPKQRDVVMVRRLKSDLKAIGIPGFPERKVIAVTPDVPADDPTEQLLALLDRYADLREQATSSKAAALIIISLQKRLLSSIEAFATSLAAHRRGLAKAARAGATAMQTPLQAAGNDDDDDEVAEEDRARDDEVRLEQASAGLDSSTAIADVLDQMTALAQKHRGRPDPRITALTAWMKEHLVVVGADGRPAFNHRRVLIFTEWMDTRRYLESQLSTVLQTLVPDDPHHTARLMTFHGGMGEERREEVKAAFNAEPGKHPLRVLIATDAAREGVNLQNHCADLFHFDLPWNPSRLEQRNGRIDRKLQRESVVRCHHFAFPSRPEDVVLRTLLEKTGRIQRELGSLSQVLEQRMARRLEKTGIRRREIEALRKVIDEEDLDADAKAAWQRELDAGRLDTVKLLAEQNKLRELLEVSKTHLCLTPEAFEDALSCALEVAGSAPLKPISGDGLTRFAFPFDDDRVRGDPSWETTLDTLRPPRPRGTSLWDWRRESKPRPVVFSDTGQLHADAVHIHLEHRVVQRLLSRFLAQGFLHHDLSRANILMSRDPRRRVVLLGKLALYGEGASRLHEEIIPITALWTDPALRVDKGLSPMSERGEDTTLALLEKALVDASLHDVPASLKDLVLPHVPADVQALLPHLRERAAEAERQARQHLDARGSREARELRDVIDRQIEAIRRRQAEVEGTASQQLAFDLFSREERQQLEADRQAWTKRLVSLDRERSSEPERIARSYDVKVARLEPLGIVYLMPITG